MVHAVTHHENKLRTSPVGPKEKGLPSAFFFVELLDAVCWEVRCRLLGHSIFRMRLEGGMQVRGEGGALCASG
jgi:hypothetical protein